MDALSVNANDSGRSRAPIWPGVWSVLPAPEEGSETVKLVDGALLLGRAASSVMQEEAEIAVVVFGCAGGGNRS